MIRDVTEKDKDNTQIFSNSDDAIYSADWFGGRIRRHFGFGAWKVWYVL